mmetsp:Transcript_8919/g.26201  ORF Transcript_8919/g.26201 Transcript_8919/m.26201 type:complete len:253 (+) Transcript_8919:581-1339(+)
MPVSSSHSRSAQPITCSPGLRPPLGKPCLPSAFSTTQTWTLRCAPVAVRNAMMPAPRGGFPANLPVPLRTAGFSGHPSPAAAALSKASAADALRALLRVGVATSSGKMTSSRLQPCFAGLLLEVTGMTPFVAGARKTGVAGPSPCTCVRPRTCGGTRRRHGVLLELPWAVPGTCSECSTTPGSGISSAGLCNAREALLHKAPIDTQTMEMVGSTREYGGTYQPASGGNHSPGSGLNARTVSLATALLKYQPS